MDQLRDLSIQAARLRYVERRAAVNRKLGILEKE